MRRTSPPPDPPMDFLKEICGGQVKNLWSHWFLGFGLGWLCPWVLKSFCGATDALSFGLRLVLPMGFKVRVDPSSPALWSCLRTQSQPWIPLVPILHLGMVRLPQWLLSVTPGFADRFENPGPRDPKPAALLTELSRPGWLSSHLNMEPLYKRVLKWP